MTAFELLDRLRRLDVEVVAEGNRLRVTAPTGSLTAELHAEIAARKLELLEVLAASRTQSLPPIVPAAAGSHSWLSFGQERLWLMHAVQASAAYNIPIGFRLRGPLDRAALERSLIEIVRRHEVLRTVFVSVDTRPVARVLPGSVPLVFDDLRNRPEPARTAEVAERFAREEEHLFDLQQGPLFRAALLQIGDDDHALLLNVHHTVFDAGSWPLLFDELNVLYSAELKGAPSPLPDLRIQYRDYAAWQRLLDVSGAWDSDRIYWQQQLAGGTDARSLPTDRPRPPARTDRGAELRFDLPDAVMDAVRALASVEMASPFMVLLAAYQAWLARYTGQDDVLTGTPVSNRQRTEVEHVIGFFVNTVVIRSRLDAGMSFRGLVRLVRDTVLAAHEHQHLPFEQVVRESRPERDSSHTPLFQTLFVYQTTSAPLLRLDGVEVTRLHADTRTAKFDVTLSLTDGVPGCSGRLEYSTDLFQPDTIARMCEHFRILLGSALADPDCSLADLQLMSEAERQRILLEFNETGSLSEPSGLHRLFEAQVERTPESVAVACRDATLTFRVLNEQANGLAARLRTLGAAPGSVLALYMERRPPLVAAMLAVLKTGAAYVPIDPKYPSVRAQWILEDSAADLLVTESHLAPRIPYGGAVLCTDVDAPADVAAKLDGPTASNEIAYIIYTSGSTGQPKGVAVEHAQATAFLNWASQVYGPEDRAGVLAGTSVSFDLSVFEIFLPLCFGGTVVLVEDVLEIHDAARKRPVTLLNTVPSAAAALLRLGPLPASVATVNLAGEPLGAGLVDDLYSQPGVQRVFDLYGVTEATTYSTCALRPAGGPVTIGRPIAGTQIYILDDRRQPVPIGVRGEIWIGGRGVARGYLHRPELTADSMTDDFVSNTPGARLYRTGDLARWRPDGSIEFVGRRDDQVKVRGYRVDLREIELELTAFPGVRQAVVIMSQPEPDRTELAACVTLESPGTVTAHDLRSYLRERLPDYMVPSSVVFLDMLPLTPTGKLDREQLLATIDGSRGRTGMADAPRSDTTARKRTTPQTPVEEMLLGIWTEVLGVEDIGLDDDFFDLGGHSLLVIYALARIRDVFHVELPVRLMFEKRTPAEQAHEIGLASSTAVAAAIHRAPPGELRTCGITQGLVWLYQLIAPGQPFFNIALRARLAGHVDVAVLTRTLNEIVQRHEVLRSRYQGYDGQILVTTAPELASDLRFTDLSELNEHERRDRLEEQGRAEANVAFDLERGPLFRFHLLRLGAREHVLLATFHHMVFDGWSVNVLLREILAVYGAFSHGRPSPLDKLPVQYADYARWQRTDDPALVAQIEYWKAKLAEPLPRFGSAASHVGRPLLIGAGEMDREPISVPPESVAALRTVAHRNGATFFMATLAAFQGALSCALGITDVRVGTLVANRQRRDTESLIGLFVNTVVLRSDVRANEALASLLHRARETTLEAYANQETPFSRVVMELRSGASEGRAPLCPIMFTLEQHVPIAPVRTASGELAVALMDDPTAPEVMAPSFELVLELVERDHGLEGALVYKAESFEREIAHRIVRHFTALLDGIERSPDLSLEQVLGAGV
jgi:amino acid adenylation domain-containing protein